jgi:ferredoxin
MIYMKINKGGLIMKAFVDQDLCISCGLCISTCEDVFHWNDDDKAEAIDEEVPSDLEELVQEAIESCPTEAIKEV